MKIAAHPAALEIRKILVAVDFGGISAGAISRGLELQAAFGAELEEVHVAPHGEQLAFRPSSWPRSPALLTLRGDPGHTLVDWVQANHIDLLVLGGVRERKSVDFGSTARTVYANAPCSIWMQPAEPQRIRTILVAVDDTGESRLALASAIDLAKRLRAVLRVVHVFDVTGYTREEWIGFPSFAKSPDIAAAARHRFEHEMEDVNWQGVHHRHEFLVGNLVEKLHEQSASVELLVLGSRARSKFVSTALGSVAYGVLAHSTKAVWVVRGRAD